MLRRVEERERGPFQPSHMINRNSSAIWIADTPPSDSCRHVKAEPGTAQLIEVPCRFSLPSRTFLINALDQLLIWLQTAPRGWGVFWTQSDSYFSRVLGLCLCRRGRQQWAPEALVPWPCGSHFSSEDSPLSWRREVPGTCHTVLGSGEDSLKEGIWRKRSWQSCMREKWLLTCSPFESLWGPLRIIV